MSDFDIAETGALPAIGVEPRKPRIALALGAGAAKGLAHIGAIEVLEQRGFEIVAIAGTSMGALIGGIYGMGKLDVYRDWVSTLARFDVLRLVDWSFSGGGFIKGDRIMAALRELIGEVNIEELSIAYTAVATDIDREREVWLTRGPLFDAIRASIAIPTLFRPYTHEGRRLVDGALLNPLPVLPLMREDVDYVVAVSVDGAAEMQKPPEKDVAAV
ncbi:MAG: patatin-like phospholipase family protein, partial [Luteibacter sp.]